MTGTPLPGSPLTPAARKASVATLVVFLCNGLLFSTWAARLPTIRDHLDFSPAQMGLVLLVGSLAAVVALPLSGVILPRTGLQPAIGGASVLALVGMIAAAASVAAGEPVLVAATFFIYVAGTSIWDVAMNVHGTQVEHTTGRAIMPLFHAGFSFGTIIGALSGWAAERAELALVPHIAGVTSVAVLAVVISLRHFLSEPASDPEPVPDVPAAPDVPAPPDVPAAPAESDTRTAPRERFGVIDAWREPRTLLIGVMVLAFSMAEGAANDWLALGVVDGFAADNSTGALGFALFVTFVTATRLAAMRLLDRFGRVAILRACAGFAIVGLGLFAFAPSLPLALAGVALWGIGAALGFPVGMSAASDEPARAALRVSVVSTIGYVAFLVGPPVLGLLAEWVGYRQALAFLLIPMVVAFTLVPMARPPQGRTTVAP